MGTATSVKLDEQQKIDLKQLASACDRTMHYLIRKAVDEFLEREKKRQQFLLDAIAADEEYERTGEGITIAQARKNAKKLERKYAR